MVNRRHDGTTEGGWHGVPPRHRRRREAVGRWETVTIYCERDELLPGGRFSAPLAGLGPGVELRVRPAPGGRGTELAGRLRVRAGRIALVTAYLAGDDPRLALRCALRQVKQLAETGEVLCPDRPAGPALHPARTALHPARTALHPAETAPRPVGIR